MKSQLFNAQEIEALISQAHRKPALNIKPALDEADCPLYSIHYGEYKKWVEGLPKPVGDWLIHIGFHGHAGKIAMLPAFEGTIYNRPSAILVYHPQKIFTHFAEAADRLPPGSYRLISTARNHHYDFALQEAALGWALQSYQFDHYKSKAKQKLKQLILPQNMDIEPILSKARAIFLGRDLINMPAAQLNPESLAQLIEALGKFYHATTHIIKGENLLQENFPLIYHVGKASIHQPHLLELNWRPNGQASIDHAEQTPPLNVTLVGKGVTFDTGGLDLKPSGGMKLMKKDMGGAASAITTATMIMAANLNVNLKLLVPAVENAISGSAFHPLDILPSRQGISIEIGDTDAEGRLILADSISYALESPCDLLIDFATLTGAARVALGTELPAIFCNQADMGRKLMQIGTRSHDPCWELPLYAPYNHYIKGKQGDLNNAPQHGYGGAIHAALFLENFIKAGKDEKSTDPSKINWVHIDMMGWNLSKRPAYPEGGEPNMARTIFEFIRERSNG